MQIFPSGLSFYQFLFGNEAYSISADGDGYRQSSKVKQTFALQENNFKSIEVFSIGYLNTNLPSKFAII
jgi:hypothetical protein